MAAKNDDDSVNRKIDDGVWRGEISATVDALKESRDVLFRKMDEHIAEVKKNFTAVDKARERQTARTDGLFDDVRSESVSLRSRIAKSEVRVAVAWTIGTIVFALILTFGSDIIDAWRGDHSHDSTKRAKE